jgi:hypothetical protein
LRARNCQRFGAHPARRRLRLCRPARGLGLVLCGWRGEKGEWSALDVNGVTLLPAHATKRCYNRRRSPWNRKEWPDETSRTSCCWVLSRGWQRAPSIPSPHRSAHISTGTTVVAGEGTAPTRRCADVGTTPIVPTSRLCRPRAGFPLRDKTFGRGRSAQSTRLAGSRSRPSPRSAMSPRPAAERGDRRERHT